MRIKALEEMREKLERDTSRTKAYPSAPIQHAFADGVTIEGYKALADKIEAEISERYMELPCDGDGEIIHIGDRLIWEHTAYNVVYTVETIGNGAWYDTNGAAHSPEIFKHVRTPLTVDEVLADFAADVERGRNTPETAKRYADEIRSILGGGR